jgi:DNA-binding NarL/FixJ family response regulator
MELPNPSLKKALIIDDDHFARIGIRYSIESIDAAVLVHEADSISSGLAAMKTTSYTFCLLDLTFMNQPDGLDALKKIRSAMGLTLPVLCVSSSTEPSKMRRAFELGACTYLVKGASQVEDLQRAIEHALNGQIYIPPIVRSILGGETQGKKNRCMELLDSLPERQYQVAELLLRGLSQKVIARELGIQLSTVKTHTSSIYARFGVEMRAGLLAKFLAESALVPGRNSHLRPLAEDQYQL